MCSTELEYERRDFLNSYIEQDFNIERTARTINEKIGVKPSQYSNGGEEVVLFFDKNLTLTEIGLINEIMEDYNFELR